MIPVRRLIGRRMLGASLLRASASRVVVGVRCQTTAVESEAVGVKNDAARPPRSNLNPKLREIRNQVSNTIQKADKDLLESIEILQEGLSYLREIQAAENIDNFTIYTIFQPIGTTLMERAMDPQSNIGEHSVEDILDILVTFGVAHNMHFYQAMVNEFSSDEQDNLYENLMKIWVKYLEYSRTLQAQNINVDALFNNLRGTGYNRFLIRDITYYAYCQAIIDKKIQYDLKDVAKLLNGDKLPEISSVRKTINGLPVSNKKNLFAKLNKFEKEIRKKSLENTDPNSREILKRIDEAVIFKDVNQLNRLYDQIRLSSNKNSIPIKQNTLFHVMSGYFEIESFDNVFRVFQDLLAGGISKPNVTIWELILRAMSHPTKVKGLSAEERQALTDNIEKTVNTMKAQGNDVTSKTLSVIVGAFANLNQFDKVDAYLQEFKKVPMVDSTKNNILIGLSLNNKIKESEKKMKEFMTKDKSFKPSTNYMNVLLNGYSKEKNFEAVSGILKFMEDHQIPESVFTVTIVIDMYFKTHLEKGQQPDVSELLELFQNSDIQFNYSTYSVIIDGLIKDGANMNAARAIYEHLMKQPNAKMSPHIVTSMVRGEINYGYVSKAEQMFQDYIKTRNEARMWNMMITALLNKNEALALKYYQDFKDQLVNGLQPNFYTYFFLLTHFVKRNRKENVQMLIDDLAKSNLTDLGNELPKVLRQLSAAYNVPATLLSA